MPHKAQDDELVMNLVEMALAHPAGERKSYLETACEGDSELFEAVWKYVQAEEAMGGFLRAPLIPVLEIEDPFEPGQLLDGRFRIVREVARGGMGIVYEALDERLDRRIALKCAMTGFRKRLPPEVRNASEISHPNICKIFEIHTASTRHGEIDFLTMEFVDGETLAAKTKGGPLPEKDALAIARQICAGLAEAHRKHVVHGDLKSGNVIVTAEESGTPRAVITDFGLAYRPESAQAVAVGGTPDYMAPELWKGAKPSTATDLYALGVLLREIVYGRGEAGASVGRRAKWDAVIRRCVEPDPARRFASTSEVAAALAPRTRRWALTAAAAALLATFSGVAAYRVATTPPETVRLAVLPFDQAAETSRILGAIQGSARTSFQVIPLAEVRRAGAADAERARILLSATHVLQVDAHPRDGKIALHALVTDTRAQVNTREWTATYAHDEARFIPTALAGVVTGTFHLPPLLARAEVNSAARQDYLSGLAYLRKHSTVEAAFPPLERALAADPDSALTHAAMAEAYYWRGRGRNEPSWTARSREELLQADRRNPDLPEVLAIGGLLLVGGGRLEQAQAAYLRAIELNAQNGDLHRRLGMSYVASGDDAKALAAFRRAVALEPGYYRNHVELGAYHSRKAAYQEALIHFAKAAELEPLEVSGHFAMATAYASLGRFADAEKAVRTAIDIQETPAALNNLGYYLTIQGRDQEALPYFNRALRWWPERYLLWLNLGDVYRRLHLLTDSRRSYKRMRELADAEVTRNPRDAYVRACLALASAWLEDRSRAVSETAQALQLAPKDADVLRIAATTYEALGMREEALEVAAAAPAEVRGELNRSPDLAELRRDSRFQMLMGPSQSR